MRKLNKKGLKQQGGQTQEQMMQQQMMQQQQAQQQQAQQQQQSLSTLIENAMSNQGYDLTEVIDELRFNDVDDGIIMEALMDMGYTQEEVQKLFQEKQKPQKFASDLSAFISEDQQKAKLGLELPQFQGDEKSENNELPKIGETNSEYIMRTTGLPGFYNNTDIWNGEKFVPNPNKPNNTDKISSKDKEFFQGFINDVIGAQKNNQNNKLKYFLNSIDDDLPPREIDSIPGALSTMFGGVKKMGRSLGVGKKNKAYNKMIDEFYADPKSYIKDNSYVAFNPQQKEFQMIYGDSSLFTPQQKEMFINQGRKLDDQVTGLDLAEMSGQPINIPFIGDINFSESQRRKQEGGQQTNTTDITYSVEGIDAAIKNAEQRCTAQNCDSTTKRTIQAEIKALEAVKNQLKMQNFMVEMPNSTSQNLSSELRDLNINGPSKESNYEGIVDYMKRMDMPNTFEDRKKLSKIFKIQNYTGLASQNEMLLDSLKKYQSGPLIMAQEGIQDNKLKKQTEGKRALLRYQTAGPFDDPESILTEEELLEKYGLMPQVTTPQDGMVSDPSQLQTDQQIKPVDSPTGIYPGDLLFDYMGGIQNYDNPIDKFLDPTSQISKTTPFGPDSFDYEKGERQASVAGIEGLDPSMMVPSNDPLSNQNVELPTPEELGFFDSSPARKTESNVQDINDEIPPEMEIDEVEPEIDEDPEITLNKKPSLKRFADFSEGAVDFASGFNTLSRIGQDAMRKSKGYANTMADTFTPQEGNRGVYSVNDGLLQPTEKASNYPTFVGRKGFELSKSHENKVNIINKLLKQNMKRGGMIVDLDTNMIAKLLAAGADIEIL